jgi:soluble lytic murein transglycosylase-like protein
MMVRAAWTLSSGHGFSHAEKACSAAILAALLPSQKRALAPEGLFCSAALLFLILCAFAAPLHSERIAAYVDTGGKVVFNNDPAPIQPAVYIPQPTAGSRGSSDQAYIASLIEQAAAQHSVDPELIRAVVEVESNYNPLAVSPKGAMGLMQLIPGTARRFGVSNVFDPAENLNGGVRYLKYLIGMFEGNLELTLAAYNAGENAVLRSRGVPAIRETRDYIRKINGIYPLRRAVAASNSRIIVRTVGSDGVIRFTNTGQ